MIYKLLTIMLLAFLLLQSKPKDKEPVFGAMLGVNAYEWDFLEDPKNRDDHERIYEPKMKLISSFAGVRHYLDWQKIEPEQGAYTFNPTRDGGWNLDTVYSRCKLNGIEILTCLKTCPDWLLKTYPAESRDVENVPIPYGASKLKPASYISQARAGFQFAARYGANERVDVNLTKISKKPRWTGDKINATRIGLNLVKYVECDNERDKWWKGEKGHQSPEEYAANLSAFYDGDKGKLGKGVGVKAADPSMQVVMAGLASPDTKYLNGMIEWCRKNRGYKSDGTVDLCFDVINFHFYANDHKLRKNDRRTVGVAPELSEASAVAEQFVKIGKAYDLPVWVTESGYDINEQSPQRAPQIRQKTALITQADWIVRTSLMFSRQGVAKLFFYQLYDDANNKDPYATSGLINSSLTRRPAANYISQLKQIMGKYRYKRTINKSPLVDEYVYNGKLMYALTMPTQNGSKAIFNLPVNGLNAMSYNLNPSNSQIVKKTLIPKNGRLQIAVTETPVFVSAN